MQQTDATFEAIFQQLQETIGRLEQGGLPLQDAVDQFEEGRTLASLCLETLAPPDPRVTRFLESAAPILDEPVF